MTPSAQVWLFVFLHVGVIMVATAYYAFSAALAPRITHRARVRFARYPWLPALIGVAISTPWVIVSLALLSAPAPALKLAGGIALALWLLLGLIGGAGIAQHIGRAPQGGGDLPAPSWTESIRGGLLLTLTWILPFVGWFAMLPLTLAAGIGCLVVGLFPLREPLAVRA